MAADPNLLAALGGIGTVVGIGMAIIERMRKIGINNQISIAKDELVKVISADRDAQKARYESEHEEFVKYRGQRHDADNETQRRLLRLTEENGLLKAKTDITPLLEHQKTQSEINAKVVSSLDAILSRLNGHSDHQPL